MGKDCHRNTEQLEEQERHEMVRAICRQYTKDIESCGDNWRELTDLADRSYEDALRALDQKNYGEFQLNLMHYADIWLYAGKKLDPVGYQFFCRCQARPSGAPVQ